MSRLPQLSGRQIVSVLEKAGFRVRRQKGSHITVTRAEPYAQVVIPDHREVAPGTLRTIIRQAGLSVDDFIVLL